MKITLHSTSRIVQVENQDGSSVPGRLWEGETETGIYVQAVITRIAAPRAANLEEFERELRETPAPLDFPNVFPLRMVI